MNTTFTAKQTAAFLARNKHRDLENHVADLRRDRLSEAERTIRDELQREYGERLAELRKAAYDAEQAELEEREAAAVDKAPYPVGTKLVRWVNERMGRYGGGPRWVEAGFGVVEICTRQSVMPANLEHGKPSIGSVLVRHLKKDGTPSARFSEWDRKSYKERWLPPGEVPAGAKLETAKG